MRGGGTTSGAAGIRPARWSVLQNDFPGARAVISIVVQERQRLLREGLASTLGAQDDIHVVAAVSSAAELVDVCLRERPDVAALEVDVPGAAAAVADGCRSLLPAMRLIGTYTALDWDVARAAASWGLERLVPRSGGMTLLLEAVRTRATATPQTAGRPAAEDAPLSGDRHGLTVREAEILALLGRGWTTNDISATLGISPRTVETHKQRACSKLGATGRAHAVALAARSGLLDRPLGAAEVLA